MKKKILIITMIFASVFIVTGCEKKKEEVKPTPKPTKKEEYVYAYYTDLENYGDNGTKLENYKKDYKELKDDEGNQRRFFLGHILDKKGKIKRGFVCGIENDKLFCVEGTQDKSAYKNNKKVLYEAYGKDKCKEDKYDDIYYMACGDELITKISSNGSVYLGFSKSDQCYSNNDTSIYCY